MDVSTFRTKSAVFRFNSGSVRELCEGRERGWRGRGRETLDERRVIVRAVGDPADLAVICVPAKEGHPPRPSRARSTLSARPHQGIGTLAWRKLTSCPPVGVGQLSLVLCGCHSQGGRLHDITWCSETEVLMEEQHFSSAVIQVSNAAIDQTPRGHPDHLSSVFFIAVTARLACAAISSCHIHANRRRAASTNCCSLSSLIGASYRSVQKLIAS